MEKRGTIMGKGVINNRLSNSLMSLLADEISPDTCRFWDVETHEKLDKDRFRRNLGGVEDAYQEVMRRLMGDAK